MPELAPRYAILLEARVLQRDQGIEVGDGTFNNAVADYFPVENDFTYGAEAFDFDGDGTIG